MGVQIPLEIFQMIGDGDEAWKELVGQTERAIGVLGGAIVEESLDRAFTCRWRQDVRRSNSQQTVREKLEGSGDLTFSMKISLAYLNKLIGTVVYNDLSDIRTIRNRFAHRTRSDDAKTWEPVGFDTQEISSRCKNLRLVDTVEIYVDDQRLGVGTPKERYLAAVSLYPRVFELYSLNPDEPHKQAAELLLKESTK